MSYDRKIMEGAEVNTTKPCYGPLMSPPIFQNKWLSKFRTLIYEVTEDYISPITNIEGFCDITAKQWMFVQEFFVQAREVSLRQANFPTEPVPEESTTPSNWTFAMTEDFVPKTNPFTAAQKILCFLDTYLEGLQSMKLGHCLAGCRWNELPYLVRIKIDEMLESRTEMEELGRWPITKDFRAMIVARNQRLP